MNLNGSGSFNAFDDFQQPSDQGTRFKGFVR